MEKIHDRRKSGKEKLQEVIEALIWDMLLHLDIDLENDEEIQDAALETVDQIMDQLKDYGIT